MRQFVILVILLYSAISVGQTTFNLRERYDFLACTLTSILPTDSCYYATGIISDTIFPYNTGTIFLKLSLDGQPTKIKTLTSVNKTYEAWYSGLVVTDDTCLVLVGYTIDSTLKALLIKLNLEGDTVFTREYFNPFYPNSTFITPRGGVQVLPDGGFIMSCNIANLSGDSDYYFMRTDKNGNLLWDKCIMGENMDRPESIVVGPSGEIIAGGIQTNQNFNAENYNFQCDIFQLDSLGHQAWQYLSPMTGGLRDAANDMLLLDDGSIIVASGVGHEQVQSSLNEVFFDRFVFKLNTQHQIEWELTYPDTELNFFTKTTKLLALTDGTGFILAGLIRTYPSSPSGYGRIEGWLAKISIIGDSVWARRYSYPLNPPNSQDIYDMKETKDGGLIICGQSVDLDDDAIYPQQGWLLKLDEYGCLVPGCQLNDATEEELPQTETEIAIYPNPTTDYLNFYITCHQPLPKEGATIRILSAEGKLMKEFKTNRFDQTFILPVWGWASGAYWVQVTIGAETHFSKQFIKLKN